MCPRKCGADRANGHRGYCGADNKIYCARAALHYWEEPCISGKSGSGTVFFCGCPLRCVYCQNYDIANMQRGKSISLERLSEIFLNLQEKGALNINLVTPTHYSLDIIEAVGKARKRGLTIPIVYNCSGYENTETLKALEETVDIYLTDIKYMDPMLAKKYSNAEDYPYIAKKALAEMVRQQGKAVFDSSGIMQKGVIVRHLLLPTQLENAKAVVEHIYKNYGNSVYISLMNQYTPVRKFTDITELNSKVSEKEYAALVDHAISLGVENGFIQEGDTAEESFIPNFDGKGL